MSNNKSVFNQGVALLLDNNLNNRNYSRMFHLLTNLSLNRFVWEGLPEGLEGRHIEKALFEHGECSFYDDPEIGLICLPSSPVNQNVYGDPISLQLHGIGYSKLIDCKDVVRVMNNDLCMPTYYHVEYYAIKMGQVDKSLYKNIKKLKTPYIVGTTKATELTMRNIMKKVEEEDEDTIYMDEKLNNGGDIGAHVLNTNTPYYGDKLQQHKNDLMCEFLTIMGLNNTNANNSKKERLLVDEVNVNNGEILMYLDVDFKNREKACKELNERFGLNVTVKKNIDILSSAFINNEEGEGNGEIHNRGLFPFKR